MIMTPDSAENFPSRGGADGSFEELLARYIDRLNDGERIDPALIRAEHPELGDKLLQDLEAFIDLSRAHEEMLTARTLGDYTLRRRVGRGGMGIVYDAWQTSMDRRVALKVLPPGVAADERSLQRFIREAKTAGQLNHQNIVGVYGLGVEANTPYYAMEFVDGETLAQILRALKDAPAGATTPFGAHGNDLAFYPNLARAFADAADGLQYAHSKGVVHRDIKPSNLILDRAGRLRILDFGLAHLEGQETITVSGDLLGTVQYMSPEQAQVRKLAIDHRTDIYSLGATLYEMLALRPPFKGKDHHDTLSQIITRDAEPLRKRNARVPRELETIVLKCLRKDPRDRYGTAEALAQDLRRFARGDAIEARPQTRVEKLASRAWRRRGRLATTAALAMLLGLTTYTASALRQHASAERNAAYERTIQGVVRTRELARLQGIRFRRAPDSPSAPGIRYNPRDFAGALESDRTARVLDSLAGAVRSLPRRPEAYYQRARVLLQADRVPEARAELAQSKLRDPGFAPAVALARALEKNAEIAAARELAAAEERPWVDAWREAHAAFADGRWEVARAAYERLLALEPAQCGERYLGSAAEELLGHGLACLAMGDYLAALQDFTVARFKWPDAAEPLLLSGATFLHLDKPELAKAEFAKLRTPPGPDLDRMAVEVANLYLASGIPQEAAPWVDRIGNEVRRHEVRVHMALVLWEYDKAMESALKLIELEPDVGRHYGTLCDVLVWYDKPIDSVERLCRDAVAANPRNGEAWAVLGWLDYFWHENYYDARREYEQALSLNPDNAFARNRYGWLRYFAGGDVQTAAVHLEKAAALRPLYLLDLGEFHDFLGDTELAYDSLTTLVKIDPSHFWARALAAKMAARLGRREEAQAWCAQVDALGSTDPRAYLELAKACQALGDLDAAEKYARRALRTPDEKGLALLDVLFSQHKTEQALADFLRLTERSPSTAGGVVGMIYHRLGRLGEALACLRRTLPFDERFCRGGIEDVLNARGDTSDDFDDAADVLAANPRRVTALRRLLALQRREAQPVRLAARWDALALRLESAVGTHGDSANLLHALAAGCLYGDAKKDLLKARDFAERAAHMLAWEEPDILATRADVEHAEGNPAQAVRTLEHALGFPNADPRLRERLDAFREAALPEVVSLESVDAILAARTPGAHEDIELLTRARAASPDSGDVLAYLEGRIRQRRGEYRDAIELLTPLATQATPSSLPVRALAECLRAANKAGEAECIVRGAIEQRFAGEAPLWGLWLSLALADLGYAPAQARASMPFHDRPEIAPDSRAYPADAAWILDALAAGTSLRINCGGSEYRDARGLTWGRDRFFSGGITLRYFDWPMAGVDIAETDDDFLYRSSRFFATTDRAAYAVPLPRGTYCVTLHFAETFYHAKGCVQFDVLAEGAVVLTAFDPAAAGVTTACRHAFTCAVADSVLDIEFRAVRDRATIAAIEVMRVD
jgi:tetratricopeptide (TPR) repeat protein